MREFRLIEGGDEDRREAEEREERIRSGEMTVMDAIEKLPGVLEERRRFYLEKYGLPALLEDSPEAQMAWKARQASLDANGGERRELYRRLTNAYIKRSFALGAALGNTLLDYAANAPVEEIRRHVWRIQRGLDEPLFGPAKPPPNRVSTFEYRAFVDLCRDCARALTEQTEAEGDEKSEKKYAGRSSSLPKFYDSSKGGFYEFRLGSRYVTGEMGVLWIDGFPYDEPRTCERCGVNDIELYRDRVSFEARGEDV